MKKLIKPIDIARKLNISTSALRHYESWGIIPKVQRSPNGYRSYTEDHIAYFQCIRAMLPGFGMDLIKEVLIKIQEKDIIAAILLVNKAQHNICSERMATERTIELLESQQLDENKFISSKEWVSIGEISSIAKVPSTALRHWERAGLISPSRDPNNGYRRYNSNHLRQILFIRSLKKSVYFLDSIRTLIKQLENNNLDVVKKAAKDSSVYFDDILKHQLSGLHSLYALCKKLDLLD
ncbi:MerR family transcriptional regulator [Clostridium sp.]|uniref:MerR family transcriptional regulator n=1 Tax=Clostridium sp. TaxID=1506 RepID=UPI002FC7FBDF